MSREGMSQARAPMESIAIVGAGQVALIAAIALCRALPQCRVEIVGLANRDGDPGLADMACTALPFTNRLHDRLGLSEEIMVREAHATHRLVTSYADWAGPGTMGHAAYGAALPVQLRTAFARHWGGTAQRGEGGLGALSLGEAMARTGRFAPPAVDVEGPMAELDYALRWDRAAYMGMLIRMAAALGVERRDVALAGLRLSETGVDGLQLADGSVLQADLYVDCTGPSAELISRIPAHGLVDWSARLPVRRLAIARGTRGRLSLVDKIGLTKAGWVAQTEGRDGQEAVLALARRRGDDDARRLFGTDNLQFLDVAPARLEAPWIGNVMALGDAAARLEPLGWTNLDLAHRMVDLLLELLPGKQIHPLERHEFNRRFALMAEATCDFVASHYAAPAASGFYGELSSSPALAVALEQFGRRGKLPFVEEAPLAGREWHGVLRALGVPQGNDALSRAEAPADHHAALAAHQQALAQAVQGLPPYDQWYRSVAGQ